MSGAGTGYGRKQVDRAGVVLRTDSATAEERSDARAIVSHWRAQHSGPLGAIRTLLGRRMGRVTPDGFVAQRLKRLSSVEAKLRRFPKMQLSRMQDLGGCRAVVPTAVEAAALYVLCRSGRQAHELARENDYLAEPKPDGYRSLHLVYRYHSKSPANRALNGLRIEIQIRSLLQHAWATAVETVDVLRETRLKIGGAGNGGWKRFFALMGSMHAIEEGCPRVADTPRALAEIRSEVGALADQLHARNVLIGMALSIDQVAKGTGWVLMTLDAAARRIDTKRYPPRRLEEAQAEYLRLEVEHEGKPAVQVCLVSTDSAQTLLRAYPNYFLDVGVFLETMRAFLGTTPDSP